MKHLLIGLLILGLMGPVYGMEYEPPPVSGPAEELMPPEVPDFGEGVWYVIKRAVKAVRPELAECTRLCLSFIAITMLTSVLNSVSGKSSDLINLGGLAGVSVLLLGNTGTLIQTAAQTVGEMSRYGQLILPIMAASIAAQGGISSSAALYTGTTIFDTILCSIISGILLPMVYMYVALIIAVNIVGEGYIGRFRDSLKWLIIWLLKTILYVFTGYMTLTGVVSGAADKTALKAAKLTISGMIPVVGSIISDASESILVGAGIVKNTIGIYGLVAVIAIMILPFLRIGIMYLLLKLTCGICGTFPGSQIPKLLQGFSEVMGFILAMTGSVCLLLLISIVCFLKGVIV